MRRRVVSPLKQGFSGRTSRACVAALWPLLAVFLCNVPAQAQAPGQKRVAVLEFRNPAGIAQEQLEYLVDSVVRGAVRKALPSDRYLLIDKENMVTLLEDKGIRLEQVCEGACVVEVGRKIGVHYILTGSVWRMGDPLDVTLKLHDTTNGNLMAQETVSGANASVLRVPLEKTVREVLSVLAPPPGRSAVSGPVFVAPGVGPSGSSPIASRHSS